MALKKKFKDFITGRSAASTLAGTESLPVIQGGITKKTTPADITTYVNSQFDEFVAAMGYSSAIVGNELIPLVQGGAPRQSTPYDFMTYINAQDKSVVSLLTDSFTYASVTAYLTFYSIQQTGVSKNVVISGEVVPGQRIVVQNTSWTLPTEDFTLFVGGADLGVVKAYRTVEIIVGTNMVGDPIPQVFDYYENEPYSQCFEMLVYNSNYQLDSEAICAVSVNPTLPSLKIFLPDYAANIKGEFPAKFVHFENLGGFALTIASFGDAADIFLLPPYTSRTLLVYMSSGVLSYKFISTADLDRGIPVQTVVASTAVSGLVTGGVLSFNAASAMNCTVFPLSSMSSVLPNRVYRIQVVQQSTGAVTLVPSGVTLVGDISQLTTTGVGSSFMLTWLSSTLVQVSANLKNDIRVITATTYTLTPADLRDVVTMNNASSNTVTFPSDATLGLTATSSAMVVISTLGAGLTTAAGSGATVNSQSGSLATLGQNDCMAYQHVAANTWNRMY